MTIQVQIPIGLARELELSVPVASEAELAVIAKLESGRAALPVLPAVAASALQIANDPNADIQRFSRLIETDPPIAARFLAVANSALYSRGKKVTSVMDAVLRIGLYSARDLLFQAAYGASLRGLGQFQAEVEASFERSVTSAIVGRTIASLLQSSFREAYLCGLLHDIGESRVFRVLAELPLRVSQAEVQSLVARYHMRAGAELAEKWKLPAGIVEVCSRHHEESVPDSEGLRLVMLADWAVPHVKMYQATAEAPVWQERDYETLERLSVSPREAVLLVEGATTELART